jgi:hypothetical protein
MADKKISALTASTTPLAGTEVLPIVQSGATVQVSVANLTAGRAISATSVTASTGDITSTAGNFVPSTAAKGVNFTANTPQAGMTSQLLNWYEEGVSTVTLAFGGSSTGITYSAQQCRYTRIGNRIFIQIGLALSSKGSATGAATISGLPFTNKNVGYGGVVMTAYADNFAGLGAIILPFLPENSSTISLRTTDISSNTTGSVTNTIFNNTSYLMISGNYFVA